MTPTQNTTPRTDAAVLTWVENGGEYTEFEYVTPDLARELETELAAARSALEAAKVLCRIYFEIAADAIGEDDVRQQRDAALAAVKKEASA